MEKALNTPALIPKALNKHLHWLYLLLAPVALVAPIMLPYFIGVLILLEFFISGIKFDEIHQFNRRQIWLMLPVLIIAGSCIWGVNTTHSLNTAGPLSVIIMSTSAYILALRQLKPSHFTSRLKLLLVGTAIAITMLLINQVIGEPLQAYKNASTGAVYTKFSVFLNVVFWASFFLFKQFKIRLLISAVTAAILIVADCEGCIAGFAIGFITFMAASWRPTAVAKLLRITVPAAVIAFPLLMSQLTVDHIQEFQEVVQDISATHRLYIWRNMSKQIFERPILGFGLNTTRLQIHPWEHQQITFKDDGRYVTQDSSLKPLHPHNFAIQIWLELGIFGFCLLLIILDRIINRLKSMQYRDITLPVFTTMGTMLAVNFSLWQTWLMATIAFGLTIIFACIGEGVKNEDKESASIPA